MRIFYLSGAASLSLLAGCGDDSKPVFTPHSSAPAPFGTKALTEAEAFAELRGTWKVVSITAGGNPVEAAKVAALDLTYSFETRFMTIRRPGKPDHKIPIAIHTAMSPVEISGRDISAIYRIRDGKLELCIMVDPKAGSNKIPKFPKEFQSADSPKTDLLVLERMEEAK